MMDKKETIMIVDDDSAIREVLKILLENEGFRICQYLSDGFFV